MQTASELRKLKMPVEALDSSFRLRAMLYGDFGVGKTHLAARLADLVCPPEKRIIWFRTDSAWTTILNFPTIKKRIDIIPFEGMSMLTTFIQAHMAGVEGWDNYSVEVVDTMSKGTDIVLRNIVDKFPATSPNVPAGFEEYSHYRRLQISHRDVLPLILSSDLHMIYTSHVRDPRQADINGGKNYLRPEMPIATYKEIVQECNILGYLFTDKTGEKRYIRLQGNDKIKAKCQIPGITDSVLEVDEFYEKVKEWRDSSEYLV